MEVPATLSAKQAPSSPKNRGMSRDSSMLSSANSGRPAATRPTKGTDEKAGILAGWPANSPARTTSRALRFELPRLMYPMASKARRCPWTDAGEQSPTAAPISRTVGG